MKTRVIIISLFVAAISCTTEMPENNLGVPTISGTQAKVEKTTRYVSLCAGVTRPNLIKTAGFYVSDNVSMSGAEKILAASVSDKITAEFLPQDYGKTYYYKAFISNGVNERCSDIATFKSESLGYYVNLVSTIESMAETYATVSASLIVAKGINLISKGFCYGDKENVTIEDNVKEITSSAFTAEIPCGRQTYIRAYVRDGSNVAYSPALLAAPITKIILDEDEKIVLVGESTTIYATLEPQLPYVFPIEWRSSNTNVATITSGGVVRGVSEGTSEITATIGDISAFCTVNVVNLRSNITVTDVSFVDGRVVYPDIQSDHTVSVLINDLPSYVSSWGIDLIGGDMSQAGMSCSSGSHSISFNDVVTPSDTYSKSDSDFTARNDNFYFRPYVIISGHKFNCGEKTPLGLIYNKRPNHTITGISLVSTTPYSSGNDDMKTSYEFVGYVDGTLFIDTYYTYYISGWETNNRFNYKSYIHSDNDFYSYIRNIYWDSSSPSHDYYITLGVRGTDGVDYDSKQIVRIHIENGTISFYLETP